MILLNERGEVCEGTITNIFVDTGDGVLVTPALSSGLAARRAARRASRHWPRQGGCARPGRSRGCQGVVRRQLAARIDPGAAWLDETHCSGRPPRLTAAPSQELASRSMTPTHTPYDGSAKPFTIGLKPLDLARWLEVDEHRDAYLAEKRRLYAEIPAKVFVAEDGTQAAQQEVLELIVGHLQRYFPALDRRSVFGGARRRRCRACLAAGPGRSRADAARRRWLAACRGVAVLSLVMVARGKIRAAAAGHPHAGARLRPRHAHRRHHPPHLRQSRRRAAGRAAQLVAAGRRRPLPAAVQRRPASIAREARPSRFPEADVAANAFIRVERQTLRKLPGSGDILFTIRIYLDPMPVLERHAGRASARRRRSPRSSPRSTPPSSTTRGLPPTATGWSRGSRRWRQPRRRR